MKTVGKMSVRHTYNLSSCGPRPRIVAGEGGGVYFELATRCYSPFSNLTSPASSIKNEGS